MRRREQVWWISATVVSLGAFSFFAGFGIRGLFDGVRGQRAAINTYPKLASAAPRVPEPSIRPQTLYWEVLKKLQLYYVEQLPANNTLALGSIDSMLNQLDDPNTRLLSKVEVDAQQDAARGEYRGLGAVLTIKRHVTRTGEELEEEDEAPAKPVKPLPGAKAPEPPARGVRTITVVSVADGGPADKAGIKPGDRITHIDGRWIAPTHVSYRLLTQLTESLGPQDLRPRDPTDTEPIEPPAADPERDKARKEADEARNRWKNSVELPVVLPSLVGGERGQHELTIERGNPAKSMKVTVALGKVSVEPVTARKLNDTTGLLRIQAFGADVPQKVAAALGDFQKSGVKSLVLDLRESPGGSIEAARAVAGILMPGRKFAVIRERDAKRELVDRGVMAAAGASKFNPATLSVLVDGGTAGSAEVLASALRDQLGVKLVGSTTFGDGAEQELTLLDNGAGISITRARMLTSKGVEFDGKGLKADVAPQGDPVDAAVKALSAPRKGA